MKCWKNLKTAVGGFARRLANKWDPQPENLAPSNDLGPLYIPPISKDIQLASMQMTVTIQEDGWWVGKHMAQQLGEELLTKGFIKITRTPGIQIPMILYEAKILAVKPDDNES